VDHQVFFSLARKGRNVSEGENSYIGAGAMSTEDYGARATYAFVCLCGFQEEAPAGHLVRKRCPRCGQSGGIVVISEEERSPHDPPGGEMVFTSEQIGYKWPPGFWHRIGERLHRGDIVMNPRTMGEILQYVTKPPPYRPGQKPGPVIATSPEEFRQMLQDGLAHFKDGGRVNKTILAAKCGLSRRTLYSYEDLFQVDVQAHIDDFLRSRGTV
jgi:hypothetical protein